MSTHTETWPDLAIGLYDRPTGRNAEITHQFESMSVHVPSGTGDNASQARWRLDATLHIRTRDTGNGSR